MPTNHKTKELSPETKLTIIIDTARLNETELAEYCRSKGLYPEQIAQWKTQTLTGFSTSEQQTSLNRKQQQADQKQIKQLKQEIKRKDKGCRFYCRKKKYRNTKERRLSAESKRKA